MSGSLKPCSYFVCRVCAGTNTLHQALEPIPVVGNGEHIGQHLALRAENEAIMLVLRHIDSNLKHGDTSRIKIYDAASTKHFAL